MRSNTGVVFGFEGAVRKKKKGKSKVYKGGPGSPVVGIFAATFFFGVWFFSSDFLEPKFLTVESLLPILFIVSL